MIALDTNILACFLLQDDPAQFKQAKALLAQDTHYTAPPTVMLELVWVLESHDCTRKEIALALHTLLGLPNFKPKAFEAICHAINHYEAGMDIGDALHLALSAAEASFVTFNKALGKLATRRDASPPVRVLRR